MPAALSVRGIISTPDTLSHSAVLLGMRGGWYIGYTFFFADFGHFPFMCVCVCVCVLCVCVLCVCVCVCVCVHVHVHVHTYMYMCVFVLR